MRLAIIIEGVQNSGKTSTIKRFINRQSERPINILRRGWRTIMLNLNFSCIRVILFCIPGSPSETDTPIKSILDKLHVYPEILIIPEQPDGKNYENTLTFLKENDYKIILKQRLSNTVGNDIWDRFNEENEVFKLDQRADAILKKLKEAILSYI